MLANFFGGVLCFEWFILNLFSLGRMALCYELDKVTSIAYRMFPHISLQLVETLVCAGSNLQHNSKCHQYWVRYMANTASPKVGVGKEG